MKWRKWLVVILFAITGCLALIEFFSTQNNIETTDYKTGLIYYSFFLISALLLFQIVGIIFSLKKEAKQSGGALIISFFFALFVAEFFLRFLGVYANYMESSAWDNYVSPYTVQEKGWYHVWMPNETITLPTGAIEYKRETNALGICEKELKIEKDSNEYRIMVLGDSFAEGWGTPSDSTWVKLLEQLLQNQYPSKKFTTINAGVAGSDPGFGYKLLEQKLLKYKPDLVLMTVNNSDEGDMIIHGGLERFLPDSTVTYLDGPAWEPIYASSYIFRLIVRSFNEMDDLLITTEKREQLEAKALNDIYKTIEATYKLAEQNNFNFAVITHPFLSEVGNGYYQADFNKLFADLNKHNPPISYVDLLKPMIKSIENSELEMEDYFVPNDSHHNSKGYLLFAQLLKEQIISKNIMIKATP